MKKTQEAIAFEKKLDRFLIENEMLQKLLEGTGIEHTLNEMRGLVEQAISEMSEAGVILDESDETTEEEYFESSIKRRPSSREIISLDSLSPYLKEYYSEYTQEEFEEFISELRTYGAGAWDGVYCARTEAKDISISGNFYTAAEEILDHTEFTDRRTAKKLWSIISETEILAEEHLRLGLELII